MDPETPESLGLYDRAKALTEQRKAVEEKLAEHQKTLPKLPEPKVIRQRASALFDQLKEVLASGPIEQKRELTSLCINRIEADPATCSVTIRMYPPILNSGIAGAHYEWITCLERRFAYNCGKSNKRKYA